MGVDETTAPGESAVLSPTAAARSNGSPHPAMGALKLSSAHRLRYA